MERERVVDFIRSFSSDREGEALRRIEAEAEKNRVPILRKESRDLLRIILTITKPERILEIGTAIGFSSVFMGENTPKETTITTIEKDPPRIIRAEANIAMAGMAERITLLKGDADAWLPTLTEPYDFIFMDAAKGQYIHFLPQVLRLLPEGGVLISDNALCGGEMFASRYGIRRRDHTIHNRMREYLFMLTHTDGIDTVILETGDGMTLSVKRDGGYHGKC